MEGRVFFLMNPNAGSFGRVRLPRGRAGTRVCESASAGECLPLLRSAVDEGYRTIVIGGGDGTIHAAVNALAPSLSRIRVGILPLGTGNDLCRTLGLPLDPQEALARILADDLPARSFDLIRLRGARDESALCVNLAQGGIGAEVARHVHRDMKRNWGPIAYVRGALEAVAEASRYELQVRFDGGEPELFSAIGLVAANGRTAGGGRRLAPLADPADGWIDVEVLHPDTLGDAAGVAARFLAGSLAESPSVTWRRCRALGIRSEPPLPFSADGTMLAFVPGFLEILPAAIRILAPAP